VQGQTADESAKLGMEIANAMIIWYFEEVDPEARHAHYVNVLTQF
jgi:hypothetical protein